MRHRLVGFLTTLLVAMLAASAAAQDGPTGRLIVALDATPPHLDQMANTTAEVVFPSLHIYETLFAFNASFEAVPMLVDTYDVDPEGKVWSFTLRQGVKFHNGKEMTVEDVQASYERWRTTSQIARQWDDVTFERVDDYAFRLVSQSTRANMLEELAQTSQALVIIPAEIIAGVPANELTEFIGTGPFMFDSLVPDQYIRMRAFPDYVSRDEPRSGLAGGKQALVAELEYRIIKDVPTRTAALRAGEIHAIPDGVPGADRAVLEADPNITVQIIHGNQKWGPIFNGQTPLGSNAKLRQAVAATLDHEEIALAITGDPDLFDINPGLVTKGTFWYNEAGAERFNYQDLELARQLLDEAGYQGEEMVIISTRANIFQDRMATVMQAQLREIGLNTRIDWYDGATIREVRTQPDRWDIIPGGWGTTINPSIYAQAFTCASGSWTGHCYPELDALFEEAERTVDVDQRREVYAELQRAMIEDFVPQILLGDFHALRAYRNNVNGVQEFRHFVVWDVSVE